jgi:dTDP-4-dehydrorhamnose reductase
MKTMLRLAAERDSLSVVNDQIGTPTNAVDLAEAILKIVQLLNSKIQIPNSKDPAPNTLNPAPYGVYHFSNEGQCSWFDFAKKIFEVNNVKIAVHAIPTSSFPTAARRPGYSVLDKGKIKVVPGIAVRSWEDALKGVNA